MEYEEACSFGFNNNPRPSTWQDSEKGGSEQRLEDLDFLQVPSGKASDNWIEDKAGEWSAATEAKAEYHWQTGL
jgi:hypothetical protein